MESISYPDNILKNYKLNENGTTILFEMNDPSEFYEILAKDDGPCWYYSTETINSESHINKKVKHLRKNQEAKAINKTLIDDILNGGIANKNLEIKINEIKHSEINKQLKESVIFHLLEYKYNHKGLGIDLYDIIKETRKTKIP